MSTLTPFATTADIALGRVLTEAETTYADVLLNRASVKLRLEVPGADELVAGDPLRREVARLAVVAAVERILKNPETAKRLTQVGGPYTWTVDLADSVASGHLYFTAADLKGLVPSGVATVPHSVPIRSGYPQPGAY